MLNQYPKPDYALDQTGASVYFTPSTITPNLDSFKVNVIVTNLGKAIRDTISVSLTRKIFDENGNPLPPFIYKKSVKGAYYIDTVSFTIPTRVGINGLGENQFSPYLDADFKIDEMDERNNGSNPVSINIQSDDIIPIYPYEFAIDSDRVVTLKASTTNTFAARRTYDFEIDTTQLFNTSNPLIHQTGTVTQIGGVVHWTPTIAYHDSVVYYWRVKIDTSLNNWHYTSFEHINGQYGWNQSHLFQWLKDDYVTLKLDSLDRTFKFPQNVNNVHVVSGYTDAAGGGPQSVPYYNMGWNLNNSDMYRYRMGGCGFSDGITFAVIDTINGVLQSMNFNGDEWGDQYGNYHCSVQAQIQYGFDFATAGTHPAGNGTWSGLPWSICIKNFITAIPAGAYVLIYSTNRPDYTQWDATLLSALSGLGFTQSVGLQNGSSQAGPFIFFTQKGNGAYTPVYSHFDGYNTGPTGLQADINFNARWFKGIMTSPVVGPAKSWSKMQWRHHAMEALTYDKDTVDIFGITNTGAQMLLTSTVINDNSIANINAVTYPYLQLRLRTEDDTTHTPTQLQYWRVLYQK
ncbi:MAG: hypothetical protein JWO06_3010, partial [Bacteroidota bacterium]|nr:hypothetical protein [Bacteroidota bacterium]